ncbi:MAG: L,D-transpeptidase family protein [Deltaproteobacteria bacterium]|nr:L,D-transpeptidase family protein [Deltaproteobacteria bacterium]
MRRMGWAVLAVLLLAGQGLAADPPQQRWVEEDFYNKARLTEPYAVVASRDPAVADTMIGSIRHYSTAKGDTFLDVARFYGLGYNELEQANPGIDPWIPGIKAKSLMLPTAWVLPQVPYTGVVVNIPEMRLYYFHPRKGDQPLLVTTYPVGLGRDEWRTPKGKFKVQGKTKNPTWIIPESIRKEHIKERGDHRTMIEGGAPDNPLGKYRLELTMPGYRIHGTDIPWGVGMQVSHGCVRLYPEDIEALFPVIPVGTPGEFIYQPVKIGARDGRIYAEVSPDIYDLVPDMQGEAQRIVNDLGWGQYVDAIKLEQAVTAKNGIPTDVTLGDEPLRPEGAGPPVRRGEPL